MKQKEIIEVIARGVCLKNGRLLLCHTKGAPNTYLPGGHVEFNESARTALEREIKEEAGLESHAGRFLGVVENVFIQKGERHCEINLVFLLDVPGAEADEAPASREDYIEFMWHEINALDSSKIEPAVLVRVLPQWLLFGDDERWVSTYI